jgi:uncharacterized Fe-S center protein
MKAALLFADYRPANLEPKNSIGAKWVRLLERLDIASVVKDKRTAIKAHLGGGHGFTSIHPYFIRKLVDAVKAGGAKEIFVTDGNWAVKSAPERGYTAEVLGCPVLPVAGSDDKYVYTRPVSPQFRTLKGLNLAGEIVNAEALINLVHVKAHGAAGFGGLTKNLSMGCVDQKTKTDLHALEGGLEWDEAKCTHCMSCKENCPNSAISFDKNDKINFFYHSCKFCQHCVLICPEKAITMVGGAFKDFQTGLAIAASEVLSTFARENTLSISFLMDITIFCDCWGMSTPALVPDIGILAGRDLVAMEQASLDLIRTENLIPGSLPKGWELGSTGHLFERVHRKDPYVSVECMREKGWGTREYGLIEVK